MKKPDRRVIRTRRALAYALIMLALEQGCESLTIRMVTERAVVGYSTFYRHYQSLDDLLAQDRAALVAFYNSTNGQYWREDRH